MLPMLALVGGLCSWALFLLPVLHWQKRRLKVLAAARFCELGMLFGSLLPLTLFVANGAELFFYWRGGQCAALTLLSIPAGALIGWIQGHRQAPRHGGFIDSGS